MEKPLAHSLLCGVWRSNLKQPLPDLNLNACLHLCHCNNVERFGRVDQRGGGTECVCVCAILLVTKVKCHGVSK